MLSPKQGNGHRSSTKLSGCSSALDSRAQIILTHNLLIIHERLTLQEKIGQGMYVCIG